MEMNTPPRILIADDHQIVRAGVKVVLQELLPEAAILETPTGNDTLLAIQNEPFDLLILDLNMPDTDSFSLVSRVLTCKPDSRVLIFTVNPSQVYEKRFRQMGVLGYLPKAASKEELKSAILSTLRGRPYTNRSAAPNPGHNDAGFDNPFHKLSDRELQIAQCLLMGYSYEQMKNALNLHISTIATHKFRMYAKLRIANLVDLVRLAGRYELDGGLNAIK